MKTVVLLLLVALAQTPDASKTEARNSLNSGVTAFRASHPREAIDLFNRALQLDPDLKVAESYLGAAYVATYKTDSSGPDRQELGRKAIETYERIIAREPSNVEARAGLGEMYTLTGDYQKAREQYLQLTRLATRDPSVFYSLGATDWALSFNKTNPLSAAERARLVSEGLQNLDIALALNPEYTDAMTYKNLLLREQASLATDPVQREALLREADVLFNKAIEARRQTAEARVSGGTLGLSQPVLIAPGPPPPPPPPSPPPQRIGSDVAQANLINQVAPVYPPLARAARLQGTVVMQVLIDRQGAIANVSVISGHELLVDAAVDAVKKWRYKPVLLNGQPIDVVTTITANFVMQ
jgi:TonB family protein